VPQGGKNENSTSLPPQRRVSRVTDYGKEGKIGASPHLEGSGGKGEENCSKTRKVYSGTRDWGEKLLLILTIEKQRVLRQRGIRLVEKKRKRGSEKASTGNVKGKFVENLNGQKMDKIYRLGSGGSRNFKEFSVGPICFITAWEATQGSPALKRKK